MQAHVQPSENACLTTADISSVHNHLRDLRRRKKSNSSAVQTLRCSARLEYPTYPKHYLTNWAAISDDGKYFYMGFSTRKTMLVYDLGQIETAAASLEDGRNCPANLAKTNFIYSANVDTSLGSDIAVATVGTKDYVVALDSKCRLRYRSADPQVNEFVTELEDTTACTISGQTKWCECFGIASSDGGFGSGWKYNGIVYFAKSNGDGVYRLDLVPDNASGNIQSYSLARVSDSVETKFNDGANCNAAQDPFVPDTRTCGDKDGSGNAVTDSDCGTGYIVRSDSGSYLCQGTSTSTNCDVGGATQIDQSRCCVAEEGGAPSALSPTDLPSVMPSRSPTPFPTETPTKSPTPIPTERPTTSPTARPTETPTKSPTARPTATPTRSPSTVPSVSPSSLPSTSPSLQPSGSPSLSPLEPSSLPSSEPSLEPSRLPSFEPSLEPSSLPSFEPSLEPSNSRSVRSSTPSGAELGADFPTFSPTGSGSVGKGGRGKSGKGKSGSGKSGSGKSGSGKSGSGKSGTRWNPQKGLQEGQQFCTHFCSCGGRWN